MKTADVARALPTPSSPPPIFFGGMGEGRFGAIAFQSIHLMRY